MNLIEKKINNNTNELSKNDIQIIRAINNQYDIIPSMKIQELANLCYTSTSTLHRIIVKLGFEGFTDLKYKLKEERKEKETYTFNSDDYFSKVSNQLELTKRLNEQAITQVAKVILENDNCYCYGTGWKQKQFVDNFSTDLLYYGKSITPLRTIDDLRIVSDNSKAKKLILIVSLGGNGKEYIDELKKHSLKNDIIISVTLDSNNQLNSLSDFSLYYKCDSINLKKHWNSLTLNFLLDYLIESIITESELIRHK